MAFPKEFLIGVGSSSYQIEGAWDADGKGESIIDRYCHTKPDWVDDKSNGDVACDSYNKVDTDLELLKELNVDFYRFSISWPRIMPNGDSSNINQAGLEFYGKLIDKLLQNGIIPMVTMYHWELPQALQDLGGWTNPILADYFVEYARVLFDNYGDRVKWWVTLNEPQISATFGYGSGNPPIMPIFPPGVIQPGVADYLAIHTMLLAHARTWHLYREKYHRTQQGKLSIAANSFSYFPASNSTEDVQAADRALVFELGYVLEPLIKGDYPQEMRDRIDSNSKLEKRAWSRLPKFTDQEKQLLKGTLDYIGLNHYSTFLAKSGSTGLKPSWTRDSGVIAFMSPKAKIPGVGWLSHEPNGFKRVLSWLKKQYDLPVFITENGCDDPKGIEDYNRIEYFRGYLKAVQESMAEDKVEVLGYSAWSFLDSFEWASGYTIRFGIYHVDWNSPDKKRTPKKSVEFFKKLLATRTIP